MTRDLRNYSSQTNVRLIFGAVFILIVVGLGLIAWLYGFNAALMGLFCLFGSLIPIIMIVLVLRGIEILVKRINKD